MAGELQHCPECREEYVAGIVACVECGQPLHPGPLPRGTAPAAAARTAADAAAGDLDRLVAELPGMQANHVVQSLLLEEIACRLECQGVVKVYQAGQRPTEPLAVTLPVSIYVSAAQFENAQEIVASLQQEDVIGEQWNEAPAEGDAERDGDLGDADADASGEPPRGAVTVDAEPEGEANPSPPVAESTTLRTIVLIVVVGLLLLLIFAR